MEAVRLLLSGIGVEQDTEVMRETPRRVADSIIELLTPPEFNASTFPNNASYSELVVIRSILFSSLCEHHLLPFTGEIHMGYLSGQFVVGLSKLARAAQYCSRGLQVQERLTVQLVDWIMDKLKPLGAGVVVEASHLCMSLRGVKAVGATTTTSALRGIVREDPRTRAEFLSLVHSGT
jgi:GTP cyclohydrolase I